MATDRTKTSVALLYHVCDIALWNYILILYCLRIENNIKMAEISACKAMTDHFEGIDKLVKEAPHTDGAPNFRRVRWLITIYIRTEKLSFTKYLFKKRLNK